MKRILHRLRLALAAASLLSTTAARAAALVASATDPTGSVAELTANATANQQPAQQPAQQPPAQQPPDQQTAQPQPPGTRIQTAPRINQPTGRISIPKLDRDLSLSDFEGMQPAPALRNHLAQAPALVQNTPSTAKPPPNAPTSGSAAPAPPSSPSSPATITTPPPCAAISPAAKTSVPTTP